MKKRILRFAIASCTVAMLPVAAQAQVGQAPPTTTQQQPGQTATNPSAPVGARQSQDRGAQLQARGGSQQTDQQLEQLFATKLMIANQGVVDLSKMATEKASSDKVKEFAQTLVKEHESLCRDIEKLQASKGRSKSDGQSQAGRTTSGQQGQPGQPGQTAGRQAGQPGQTAGRQGQGGQQSGDSQGIIDKLESIAEKSSKKQLEMAKEMLEKRDGENFDMAFVGLQVAAHTRAVADLSALQGVGSKEMQDVVKQAEDATKKHLEKAKDLAEQLSSK